VKQEKTSFHNVYSQGFLRAAVGIPQLGVADPDFNIEQTLVLVQQASDQAAAVVLFPELGLSAYSNEDLFHQDALLDAVEASLAALLEQSKKTIPIVIVGLPLRVGDNLFNCGAVIYRGQLLGVVPKTYLPNYREFYEKRYFVSATNAVQNTIECFGQNVPFGNDLIFNASNLPGFRLYVEICEDLWVPIPPSTYGALAGATVLANLSASNITIGKASYRRDLCAAQSSRCIASYLYAAAGSGESTTDLAWDGHGLIYENNELLAEAKRFTQQPQLICADIDLERLRQERMRMSSFNDCAGLYKEQIQRMRIVEFEFAIPTTAKTLFRTVSRFPYVPSNPETLSERCAEAYRIQTDGLVQRLRSTKIEKVVIGISGGLDSTQALIICINAFDQLSLPRSNILGYTMPGFATSEQTLENSWRLMRALGISAEEIDIKPSCRQMLKDIDHPFARGEPVYDVTFENIQAGERTSHLFRLANCNNGMVIGTGDLSELALGWTTYGVGDHMSHYAVNASVPKTLIQHLIRWVIDQEIFDTVTGDVLNRILNTTISPELIPGENSVDGPSQKTESIIGPYELQDFNLYYISRFGFRPSKVAFLAYQAWADRERGEWPLMITDTDRNQYDLPAIKRWLEVFLERFFEFSQFKRSAIPNAPKVGSGGSLSPRSDWRAPSDAGADVWIKELHDNVPDE